MKIMIYVIRNSIYNTKYVGRDSSVGMATLYGLNGPGIESRWGRDLPHPTRLGTGATQPLIKWGDERQEGGLDHPPHLMPRLKKELSYTSTAHLDLRWPF